jgi:pimeloyl-ACP methyl ester carboxylesterase
VTSPDLPQLAGISHRWVDVGGLRVHVAEAGQGAPLVLLHGWPQHWWCWRRVVPLLADSYRLVVPDLRGHGWTDAPEGGYDKEQLATDLLGLLDALDLPRVGLVGHDWGGWTGFLAALRAPERFSAFLALGIVHPFQRPTLARALESWRLAYQVGLSTPVLAERVLQASPALVEAAVRAGSTRRSAFADGAARTYGEVLQEPARARASSRLYREFVLRDGLPVALGRYRGARLRVPTRLVVGAGDPVASPALLEGWQDHADDMQVEVLPGVGHFVPEEAPEEVARRARVLFG